MATTKLSFVELLAMGVVSFQPVATAHPEALSNDPSMLVPRGAPIEPEPPRPEPDSNRSDPYHL